MTARVKASRRAVWLVVDGTVPVDQELARTATRLVWTGHKVTVVLAVPKPSWTLNVRLAERQQRERAELLRRRHDELSIGLQAGLGDGPFPAFAAGARVQVRWTGRSRPRLIHRIARRLGRQGPATSDPLPQLTELRLAAMPARTRTVGRAVPTVVSRRER